MASKISNTSCPAEKYKDIKCPQTKKGQKKILLKIHPDRNRGCTELARKLSQKILNCPYEANGNLDNVELITRAMEQKVAAGAAAHAASAATKSTPLSLRLSKKAASLVSLSILATKRVELVAVHRSMAACSFGLLLFLPDSTSVTSSMMLCSLPLR